MTGLNTKVLPIPTSHVSWFHIPLFYKVLLIRFVILNLKLKCVVSGWPYRNWPPNLITPRICENRQMCQAYLGPSKPCFKYFICRQGKDPFQVGPLRRSSTRARVWSLRAIVSAHSPWLSIRRKCTVVCSAWVSYWSDLRPEECFSVVDTWPKCVRWR